MDKFLKTHSLPNLPQKETENLNNLLSVRQIESILTDFSKEKSRRGITNLIPTLPYSGKIERISHYMDVT